MWFYTKRPEQQITLNEQVLPWSSHEKYLGIQLDSNMTFTYQANCVAAQAKKNMNAMKVMSSFTHISAHIMKRVYSACVQSTLEYGAILMCKSNIITLQRVQNQGMRLILRTSQMDMNYLNVVNYQCYRYELDVRYPSQS